MPTYFTLFELSLILKIVFVVVPDKKGIVRMFQSFLKIPDVPITIGICLYTLPMRNIFTPTSLIHEIVIGEFALSRNFICMNIPDEVGSISKDKIIFLALAIAIHKYAYQNRSIRKDGDSLAIRLMVFPFSTVASIVNVELEEALELLHIVVSLLPVLNI